MLFDTVLLHASCFKNTKALTISRLNNVEVLSSNLEASSFFFGTAFLSVKIRDLTYTH